MIGSRIRHRFSPHSSSLTAAGSWALPVNLFRKSRGSGQEQKEGGREEKATERRERGTKKEKRRGGRGPLPVFRVSCPRGPRKVFVEKR